MRRALVVLVFAGCAAGHIDANGRIYGAALGHAKIEHCVRDDAVMLACPVKPPRLCNRIEGGALSSNFTEALSSAFAVISTFITAYFAL